MRLIDADKLVHELEGLTWYHINKKGELVKGANSSEMTPLYKAEDIYMYIDNVPTFEMPNWYKVYEDVKSTFEKYQSTQIAWEQGYEAGIAQGKSERPHGYWNYIQANMAVCPFCGASPNKDYKNFCPNCGADMKGGAKE